MRPTTLLINQSRRNGRILNTIKRTKVIFNFPKETNILQQQHKCYLSSLSLQEKGDDIDDTDVKRQLPKKKDNRILFQNGSHSLPSPFLEINSEKATTSTNTPSSPTRESPTHVTYTGDVTLPLTSVLKIQDPEDDGPRESVMPVFRLMDEDGTLRNDSKIGATHTQKDQDKITGNPDDLLLQNIQVEHATNKSILTNPLLSSTQTLLSAHRHMIRLRQMDNILQNAQRQGRISFYMSCRGEESIHIGSASALTLRDTIWAQYREAGVLMWRGFSLEQFTDQCFSNDKDLGRGRQMPVHYGSRALNYHTISSPLGTQIIQAVGAGYFLKREAENRSQGGGGAADACSVVYFGDGCGSTSDFHAGCNFAATLECPVVFICRNNGFAISTPVNEQYRGDGIVGRAPGYGMAALRVDGNDVFAVAAAVREAKRYVLEHSKPIMVECMTYRLSHHSTSDDSTRYRSRKDLEEWGTVRDPVRRLDKFLYNESILTEEERGRMKDEERMAVLQAMEKAERRSKPHFDKMFEDVYYEKPLNLRRQENELLDHLKNYEDEYKTANH